MDSPELGVCQLYCAVAGHNIQWGHFEHLLHHCFHFLHKDPHIWTRPHDGLRAVTKTCQCCQSPAVWVGHLRTQFECSFLANVPCPVTLMLLPAEQSAPSQRCKDFGSEVHPLHQLWIPDGLHESTSDTPFWSAWGELSYNYDFHVNMGCWVLSLVATLG